MFTTAVQRTRDVAVRHPLLLDAVLGGALAGPAVLAAMSDPRHPAGPAGTGGVWVAALACVLVACRRLWPLPVLLATAAAAIAYTLVIGSQQPVLTIALVVAVYTVTLRIDRNRMWLTAAAVALPLYLATALTSSSNWWAPQNLGVLAWIGMATAVGDATGSRRAYVAEVEERARRAEQTREDEARSRVVEERMRIARELHDVVSHHIAVINVQAGAARHVLRRQPDAAATALEHVRQASDTVLRELSSIVGVLRQAGDGDNGTEPTRGLARLSGLLDALGSAGFDVEYRRHGEPRELPAMVDLAAYRIVQEALTNAHKHGTGGACLIVAYTAADVVLDIRSPTGLGPRPGGGYGIVGMRERATAAGGTLTIDHGYGGQFRVHAVLPAPKTKDQP